MGKPEKKEIDDIVLKVPFGIFSVVTVSLPAFSLLYCFLTGIIFRFYDVNETVCKATNVIPSISAVTGITPGAYVWRVCIGLHATPRFAVGVMHYNYYMKRLCNIREEFRNTYKKLLRVNFWLYTIENSCLVLVTYISNKENYPVHEKIFVVFMVTSCCYMLLNTLVFKWSRSGELSDIEKKSLKIKWIMFVCIMSATAGLLTAFVLHRIYCVPYAFSFFSAFEYIIAYSNMGYHVSAYYEFQNKFIVTGYLKTDNSVTNGDLNFNQSKEMKQPEDDVIERRNLRQRKKGLGERAQ